MPVGALAPGVVVFNNKYPWIMGVIFGGYLVILLPIWILIVRKNEYTRTILTSGWTPVLSALENRDISLSGGLVLDSAVGQFIGYEVFQPIINGIGGNLVSVQASRISTMLHKTSIKEMSSNEYVMYDKTFPINISNGEYRRLYPERPVPDKNTFRNVWNKMTEVYKQRSNDVDELRERVITVINDINNSNMLDDVFGFNLSVHYVARTARILLLMSLPGQFAFVFVADFIYSGAAILTPIFVVTHLISSSSKNSTMSPMVQRLVSSKKLRRRTTSHLP
ncbi:hypothetical protein NQ317_006086 [Molorchus minor]|uniref:Uncharacterized protein n=1 Tax=Molorchus minor TaxID=1323400 RepID=A0ABQ9IU11_9CUCU|nr:hypothetical protein NQ317_006086 [Molorchus minor]